MSTYKEALKDSTGRRIRRAMIAAGKNRAKLAAELGVAPATVSRWCHDGNKTAWDQAEMGRVAQALRVTPGWLLMEEALGGDMPEPLVLREVAAEYGDRREVLLQRIVAEPVEYVREALATELRRVW